MVLRKLSIFGFKSFADKTDVEFGEGVTAVIGPNGCGKSNVIDAVRWVFGEQRPTALRSANMQDVIFSGAQKRSALNMAEVTLTIENTKKLLPTDYHDVAITRRIYRSGESEYLINKVPCRLRDIHTMFLDTGVGNSSYTTIEHGMINSILSDKAEERRVLFEEAAGIGKYKERRRDSLRQLDKTRQDLLRINDTVQEADRQVRMLARHVDKANRYKRYFGDLKTLEVGFENRRYETFTGVMTERKKEMDECEEKRQAERIKAATSETTIETMRLSALEEEKDLEIASRTVSEANEKIIAIDRDLSVSRERLAFQRENVVRCEREMTGLAGQIQSSAELKTQVEKGVIEHSTEHDQCKEKVERAQAGLAAVDAKVESIRRESERLSAGQIEAINAIGDRKNVIASLRSTQTSSMERSDRDEKELLTLQSRLDEYKDAVERCRSKLASAHESQENLGASRQALLGRIEKEDTLYQELVEKEKRLEAQIDSCKSQRTFLEGLDASFEGYETGVKALLAGKTPGAVGIVADLVRVPDEAVVGLVERVLGQAVQTVVFNTDSDLKNAVSFLNSEKAGYARMVSLERLRKLPARSRDIAGTERMRSYVQTSSDHECVADYLFSTMYLTQTADDAMGRSQDEPGSVFVSRDGVVCLENGCVLAGKPAKQQAGLLQRKQQIEKLASDVERFEKEYQRIVHEKEICIINRDEAKFALVEVDEKLNAGRRMQQEQETTIKHNENESRSIDSTMDNIRTDLDQTRKRVADCEAKIREAEAACEELTAKLHAIEADFELSRQGLAAAQDDRNRMAEHLKNIELEMMALTNRIAQDRQDADRLAQNIVQFTAKRESVAEEKRGAETEIVSLEAGIATSEQDLVTMTAQRVELEHVRDERREKYNAHLIEIEEIRKALKTESNDIEELSNRIHGLELDQTRDDQEKRRIRERIWNTYEVDLESPPAEGILHVEEDDAVVSENIAMFKERLRRLGEVNMVALSDFESESARLKDMTIQRDDLQTAVDDLEKAIKKLDKEARAQFVATFEQVQKNFVTMFTTLFEGGEAYLSLEENADPLEAAITINVRPAGKKMRGVNLLSGGERALTAISLLFSLYLVKPSAYCILDELDAPLDDANIGRFVNLLKKFSEQTQFIVVTHNKRTMEAADILYGVTQQERGVSTIMSVKFEEAALQAA
jgi:chromosome segregation protein